MRYREIPAPAGLSGLIHCIWYLESEGLAPVQPVVPDGRVEIVIHLGEPFSELDREGRLRRQAEVMVGGQLTRPVALVLSSTAVVVGIRLTSAGAGAILPVREITNQLVSLESVRRDLSRRLLDAFAGGSPIGEQLPRVAQVVASAARRGPSALAAGTMRMIETGEQSVRALAAELGVTPRTLQRRFREEVGVSPVLMRRIVRFRRVFGLLTRSSVNRAARLAASAGYYDQAHFIREFRQFAGMPPGKFFSGRPDMAAALLGGQSA